MGIMKYNYRIENNIIIRERTSVKRILWMMKTFPIVFYYHSFSYPDQSFFRNKRFIDPLSQKIK